MESVLFSGLVDLPWWGVAMVALLLTHITIASVTIFLLSFPSNFAFQR